MVDNNYQTMSDRKVKKIPGMIAGGEKKKKVKVDLRRTLCAFVKKTYELYFQKLIFREKKKRKKKKPLCFCSKGSLMSNLCEAINWKRHRFFGKFS